MRQGAPSAVTITTCLDTDYALIIWRCQEHADAAITEATRLADHAIITVQPVDETEEPDAPVIPFACQRRPAPAAQEPAAHAGPANPASRPPWPARCPRAAGRAERRHP